MAVPPFHAVHGYGAAKNILKLPDSAATQTVPSKASESGASAAFDAAHSFAATIAKGEKASIAYMSGSADPHSVIEALAAAELAVETAVTIRDKVVEAYQELLRMPV